MFLLFYQRYDLEDYNFFCIFYDELYDSIYFFETICIRRAKMNSDDIVYEDNSLCINNWVIEYWRSNNNILIRGNTWLLLAEYSSVKRGWCKEVGVKRSWSIDISITRRSWRRIINVMTMMPPIHRFNYIVMKECMHRVFIYIDKYVNKGNKP